MLLGWSMIEVLWIFSFDRNIIFYFFSEIWIEFNFVNYGTNCGNRFCDLGFSGSLCWSEFSSPISFFFFPYLLMNPWITIEDLCEFSNPWLWMLSNFLLFFIIFLMLGWALKVMVYRGDGWSERGFLLGE